jgi:hypothetical protein
MSLKLTQNTVKSIIESFDCVLLSDYKNANSLLLMQCKCGNQMTRSLNNFKGSKHKSCDDCAKKIKFDKLRNDPKEVKKYIESFGCELLDTYISANKSIRIKCSCGSITKRTFTNFKECENKICHACVAKKTAKKRAPSFESVKTFIEKAGCKLLSTEYKNANTPMLLQCRCGDTWNVDFHIFKRSKHKACKLCSALKLSTDRVKRENGTYIKKDLNISDKMRKKILKRDNYCCKKCGVISLKKRHHNLNVHHLYNKIQYPKWNNRVSNLITLCNTCHKSFHKTFGIINNTPKQMKIYLKGNN